MKLNNFPIDTEKNKKNEKDDTLCYLFILCYLPARDCNQDFFFSSCGNEELVVDDADAVTTVFSAANV